MGRNKKTLLLFLPLALLYVSAIRMQDFPTTAQNNLTCYNDFNRNITCVWNSTYVLDHADTLCTIHAKKDEGRFKFSNSCNLEPVDVSRPALKKCSLIFKDEWTFQEFHKLTFNLSCNHMKQSLIMSYKPFDHIKLNPPPKPQINFSTVSWYPQVSEHQEILLYTSQLQWKQEDQSWSNHFEPAQETVCKFEKCAVELDVDRLIQGQRYEARIRVKASEEGATSVWSEWSPTASWESLIGRKRPPTSDKDVVGGVLGIMTGVAAFVVFLAILRFKTDKITWVYMIKIIRGPPLPNPAHSFLRQSNFQHWLSPHFTSESFNSYLKPEEFVSVEVTSAVDAVVPYGLQAPMLEKKKTESSYESTSSSFSNPSYSQLSPLPPVSSLTAGNLEPCGADTPYGPVGSQDEGRNAEQDRHEERGKEVEILQLLSKGSNNSEPMLVMSDYEKVEKPQVECFRLQSLDSGMCSGEEVSQESLEADSISVTDGHDEGPEGKEERAGDNGRGVLFPKLFGGSGGIFGKGSIQVCSDYERVQKLQAYSPELASLDSGISSGGEEQVSQEESLEDVDKSTECTSLLFPPAPPHPSATSGSLPSFPPLPLHFSGPCLSPALPPLASHILQKTALMSINMSMEPSGDGYMPVRKEQS